MLTRLVI